jgi:phosphoserine aminotransferase
MLCVEDYLDTLQWAQSIGGLKALIGRADANAAVVANWISKSAWAEFLAVDPKTRSNTSVCLAIKASVTAGLDDKARAAMPKAIASALDDEGVAFDIGGYRDAPPGLRIWAGSTVETANLEALMPWLDWAYAKASASALAA